MRRKRLTDTEIRKAVEKIRESYAHYIVQYQKGRHALNAFEERYISALRARLDLAYFLHAEKEVVEQLVRREEDRIRDEELRQENAVLEREKQKSVSDRIVAEHMRRIEKYPRLHIHEDCSPEVERLFGALRTFEREFWADLEFIMRKAYTSLITSPRQRLEERLLQLCGAGRTEVPPRLSRYLSLFEWFPRNTREIEKEANKCILEAAFFLHDMHDTLKEIRGSEELDGFERDLVERMGEYVHTMIEDFRLKEFRKQRR